MERSKSPSPTRADNIRKHASYHLHVADMTALGGNVEGEPHKIRLLHQNPDGTTGPVVCTIEVNPDLPIDAFGLANFLANAPALWRALRDAASGYVFYRGSEEPNAISDFAAITELLTDCGPFPWEQVTDKVDADLFTEYTQAAVAKAEGGAS